MTIANTRSQSRHDNDRLHDHVGRTLPTLYDWTGGAAAFEKLFHALCERVPRDGLPAPLFAGPAPSPAEPMPT